MKRYWESEMAGLKLTPRGEMVFNILGAIGTAAVLVSCIAAGWAFLAMIVTK